MLKFIDPRKELPKLENEVLIRYKDYEDDNEVFYYVAELQYDELSSNLYFVESQGEHYYHWRVDQVIGWIYVSELDSIE